MNALAAVLSEEQNDWNLKMKDLCQATGVSRQVVHFYVQQGLLPPGKKTGQNMAYYGQEHVRRIELIKQLQEERFLPLKAIKALFDEQESAFSPNQRDFLRTLRTSILEDAGGKTQAFDSLELLAATYGIEKRDLDDLEAEGLIRLQSLENGRVKLRSADLQWIEILSHLRVAGLTRELGFHARDLQEFGSSMNALIRWEVNLVSKRMSNLDAHEAGERIRNALPVIHKLIAHIHQSKIEDLLSAL